MSDRIPYIDDAAAAGINREFGRVFATFLQLSGTEIRLYRDRVAVGPPVRVLIEVANRQSRESNASGALDAPLSAGTVSAWAPWDVERGDRFRYGSATAVIRDVPPAADGVQSATFEMSDGGGDDG